MPRITRYKTAADAVLGWIVNRDPDAPHLRERAAYMHRAILDLSQGRLALMATLEDSSVAEEGRSRWTFSDGSAIEGIPGDYWETRDREGDLTGTGPAS